MKFFDGLLVLGFNFIKNFNENFLFKLFLAHIFWVFAPIWWKLTIVGGRRYEEIFKFEIYLPCAPSHVFMRKFIYLDTQSLKQYVLHPLGFKNFILVQNGLAVKTKSIWLYYFFRAALCFWSCPPLCAVLNMGLSRFLGDLKALGHEHGKGRGLVHAVWWNKRHSQSSILSYLLTWDN